MKIGNMENRSCHSNLHFHGFPESCGTRDSFLENIISEMMGKDNFPTRPMVEQAHRTGPRAAEGGKPRSIIGKFLNYWEKEKILHLAIQANKTNPLIYEGHRIFITADMSTELYQRRKKYAALKKQLWEKHIPFTFCFPAELHVKWEDKDVKFSSAEEAAKFVERIGLK